MAEQVAPLRDGKTLEQREKERIAVALLSYEPEPNSGCWLWTGLLSSEGYGFVRGAIGGSRLHAHRLFYRHFKGPIPPGLHLDHLCRIRCCVNPAHLEAVSCRVNLLRGDTLQAKNAAKTSCPKGHPYTPENTCLYRRPGRSGVERHCRSCRREASARRRRKAKEDLDAAA